VTTAPDPTPQDLAEESDPAHFDPDRVWPDEPGADQSPEDEGDVETGATPVVES
jgi:hypothetical protein